MVGDQDHAVDDSGSDHRLSDHDSRVKRKKGNGYAETELSMDSGGCPALL